MKKDGFPAAMQGCIPLSDDELALLRDMLNRALMGMNGTKKM